MSRLSRFLFPSLFLPTFVTTEPAHNDSILFNKILGCFSETIDQNCMLRSQSMHRGETFHLQLHLEPSLAPLPHTYERNHKTKA